MFHQSCELLSKIIIFVMKDNKKFLWQLNIVVVNCFQKLLSSWWRTTSTPKPFAASELWIAFKNYYLRDEGQLNKKKFVFGYCCELLSKIITFVMKDNIRDPFLNCIKVVNCFQKLLPSWWRTTFQVFIENN